MHICLLSSRGITDNLATWGGVNTHTKNLVSLLLDNGHHVSLITCGDEKIKNGVLTIYPISNCESGKESRIWFKKANELFFKIHKSKPIDFVFSEGGAARGLSGSIHSLNIPIVAFVHNLSMHYFFNKWQEIDGLRSLKSYLFRTIPIIIHDILFADILFLSKCEKIVTGSKTIAKQINQFYRIPKEKIMLIHNWIDPDLFKFDNEDRIKLREKLEIQNDDILFLLVGSVWKPKGFRITLHAFKDLLKILPNAYLVIVGDGPDRPYLEKYASQSEQLKSRVKILGPYAHNKLYTLYSCSDIFIIPSLLNEVLPYTLLEAMSCELPIIASAIPANREALGDAGLFFPRGNIKSLTDAMLTFASDPNKRKTHAMNNKKRFLELFSRETASMKIEKLLNEFYK